MRRLLLGLLAATLGACGTTGPRTIRHDRGRYNAEIHQTDHEQLLINLVRLRHGEMPLLLAVTGVTRSGPKVVYTPVTGERLAAELLRPIKLGWLLQLYSAGLPIDRILKIYVDRLEPLQRDGWVSGPTPDFEKFVEVTEILRSLQDEGLLDLRMAPGSSGDALSLQIKSTSATSPRQERLTQLLGLQEPASRITLRAAPGPEDRGAVAVTMRSPLAVMNLAANGVEVPAVAAERAKSATTKPFDWTRVTGAIVRVQSGRRAPADAFVAVQYRRRWFFIEEEDLDSRVMFSFIALVLALQSMANEVDAAE